MTNLLLVGSGDIARRLLPLLRGRYSIHALLRDPKKFADWRAGGATPRLADLDDRRSLACIAGVADVVIHLAPAVVGRSGDTDFFTGDRNHGNLYQRKKDVGFLRLDPQAVWLNLRLDQWASLALFLVGIIYFVRGLLHHQSQVECDKNS